MAWNNSAPKEHQSDVKIGNVNEQNKKINE